MSMSSESRPDSMLTLSIHRALIKPGLPWPVSGKLSLPDGAEMMATGFLDPQGEQGPFLDLQCVAIHGPKAKARGRPNDDGRRMAVLLAFKWFTEMRRLNKSEAYDRVAKLLAYRGEREVRRVINHARTTYISKKTEAICGAHILYLEGVSIPDYCWALWGEFDSETVRANKTRPIGTAWTVAVKGWLWQTDKPRAAYFGKWTLNGKTGQPPEEASTDISLSATGGA